MPTMKTILFSILALVLRVAAETAIISNGSLAPDWKANPWNDLHLLPSNPPVALTLAVDETGKAWSGVAFKRPTALSLDSVSNLALVLVVNGSKDRFGTHSGAQRFQVSLALGARYLTRSKYLPAVQWLDGKAVDASEETWQCLVLPLSSFDGASEVGALDTVAVQYMGDAPKSGISISQMFLAPFEIPPVNAPAAFTIRNDVVFPNLAALPKGTVMPKGAKVTVSPTGNYLVDGQVRFFTGVQCEADVVSGLKALPGYADDYKWFYESPLTHESAQRLGIDSIGQFYPSTWTRKYLGGKAWAGLGTGPEDEAAFGPYLRGLGLPVYVDMTCEIWTHGVLARGNAIPETAKSDPRKSHFLRYSILHPDGLALYREMVEHITRRTVENGVEPLFYELFNEPAYHDDNPWNRRVFMAWLTERYGSIEKLNGTWGTTHRSFEEVIQFQNTVQSTGLSVDWNLFLEETFTRVAREMRVHLRQVDPNGRTAVQIMGGSGYRNPTRDGINIYEVSRAMDVVSLPTGGGWGGYGVGATREPATALGATLFQAQSEGILMAKFFLNCAGGTKPLHDAEFYGDATANGLVSGYWIQLARGLDASYLFKFDKRGWDWKNESEGKRKAEEFPYLWLNPYAKSVETIAGIRTFKEEMKKVEALFVGKTRPRGRLALLVSFPTARASKTHPGEGNEILSYAGALAFSHWDYDVLMEEDLNAERLSRYDGIIAAGVRQVYAGTQPALEAWVRSGGHLYMALEILDRDEYERPRPWKMLEGLTMKERAPSEPDSVIMEGTRWTLLPGEIRGVAVRDLEVSPAWRTDAIRSGQPALVSKAVGKGRAHVLGVKMADYGLAALLGTCLTRQGISRAFDLVGDSGHLVPNVEFARAERGDLRGFFLYNWDLYSKAAWIKVEIPKGFTAYDPVDGEAYEIGANGVALHLKPQTRKILVIGPKPSGDFPLVRESQVVEKRRRARLEEDGVAGAKASEAERAGGALRYPVDIAKTKTIDLRPFCNRAFVDRIAGDGVGGWTDEGENSLRGVPDGLQNFLGVPFDIIRWDMNQDRSCVVLGSRRNEKGPREVTGIPVGVDAAALYFLHATGWATKDRPVCTYRIRYADGAKVEVPIQVGRETADWWISRLTGEARVAWQNSEKKGFYAWKWTNPRPGKTISAIDLVSAMEDPIQILVGITAELR